VSREIWIGLVEVSPLEGNDIFDGAPGAFTNVLAEADGLDGFRASVLMALEREGLTVIEIEDAEPLRERLAEFEVDEEILRLAPEAASNVVWHTFHVYESDADE
jgi:hypothetical protein